MRKGSIFELSDWLVKETQVLLKTAKTEEDLRIGFEKLLEPTLKSIGVDISPRYERLSERARTVYKGRPDAVHGRVIIEYEAPGSFESERKISHAYDQLTQYITAESSDSPIKSIAGVGFDGYTIFFVRYVGKKGKAEKGRFTLYGPYTFNVDSARTFLAYIRGLARLPLNAENLAARFGPKSDIAPLAVSAVLDALENWGNTRTAVYFDEWKRLFGIVYGEQFASGGPDGIAELAKLYGVKEKVGFQNLLFSVHTYFALLMKLITAELISLKETDFSSSFATELTHGSTDEFKHKLTDIEEGGVYSKQGITNFLEGDFFRWYLGAFSPRLQEAFRETARALSQLEPATTIIEPESTRDLLKKLYQYLVPKTVRHHLGEYYTPDWLAELVLNESGYKGKTLKRFLDPACGSGTFLVLAIQRAKEYGAKQKEPETETAKRILANILGFDLNPLAVIAARTNYIFALGDLTRKLPYFEIPIYLADSVLWPEKVGPTTLNFAGGDHAKVMTSIGEFHVPAIWIKDRGFLMSKAAPLVETMVRESYSVREAMKRLKAEGLVFPPHEKVIENFYADVLELEEKGKNGIWARFLKNVFAPTVSGKFDFVVGNPPWVRWGYLSREYRKATESMWKDYGLFSLKGFESRLGAGEKDFSMLFIYAAADFYLKKGGKLGFLITQEVFKSKGAGQGFRRFQIGDRDYLKVMRAHDLVSVQPFEGAANKTAAIILKKGQKTAYPVSYTIWKRKKGVGKIATDLEFAEAKKLLTKKKLKAGPVAEPVSSWQTFTDLLKGLDNIKGENPYKARLGARVEPYGVFWLEIKQVLSDGDLLIRNQAKRGKRKVEQVEERVEPDLVFPAVSGRDVERWGAEPGTFVLMPQDPQTREPYSETRMKENWPQTYSYFTRFKNLLLSRGSAAVRELAERTAFYAMYGIGPYTVARYKVVWKRMSTDIFSAVISQYKTIYGYKKVIPTDTTSLFATSDEQEAHYLCAIINSTPVREFIKSYSSAGRGFGAPSVMKHVGIPVFDKSKALHKKLAETSKKLHGFKAKNDVSKLEELEKSVDGLVKKLFKIK